jgi:hypothetical protein
MILFERGITMNELTDQIKKDVKGSVIGLILSMGPVSYLQCHRECMEQVIGYDELSDWNKSIAVQDAIASGLSDKIIEIDICIDSQYPKDGHIAFDVAH